jgi:hypothetical protein
VYAAHNAYREERNCAPRGFQSAFHTIEHKVGRCTPIFHIDVFLKHDAWQDDRRIGVEIPPFWMFRESARR